MKNRCMKHGMMIIATVLLVAIAFAGAASAASPGSYTATTWNDIAAGSTLDAGTYSITGFGTIDPKNTIFIGTGKVVLDFSGYGGTFAGSTANGGYKGSLFGNVHINSGNTLEIIGLKMKSVTVTSNGPFIGGIIGRVVNTGGTLNITNCQLVNCSITQTSAEQQALVGGMVGGCANANVNVKNCKLLHCDVVGNGNSVSGLIGSADSNTSFVGCNVTNSTVSSTGGNVGGLIGYTDYASFTMCGVENTSVYASDQSVGGLSGWIPNAIPSSRFMDGCTVKNCVIVSTSKFVGGLAGTPANALANGIRNCHVVNCTIAGNTSVGGLVGSADASGTHSDNSVEYSAVMGTGTNVRLDSGSGYSLNCAADLNTNFIYNMSSGTSPNYSDTITLYKSTGGVKQSVTLPDATLWKTIYNATGAKSATPTAIFQVTYLGEYGKEGGYGVGSNPPELYVEVSDWQELVDNVAGYTGTKMRTIVLTNTAAGAYTNTTGATNYAGIPVSGNITITPASGTGEIKIDANQKGRLFIVQSDGKLTLIGNGTDKLNLTGGKMSTGGGIYVDGGNLTLADGASISGCSVTSSNNGGGVFVYHGGSFTMNGGTITGCSANQGSGVFVDGGSFTMNGGTITKCSADTNGGGVFVYNGGSFTMNGGTITKCSANQGGGVAVHSSTFTMNGTALVTGDNEVYLYSGKKITLGTGGFASGHSGAFNITPASTTAGTVVVEGQADNVPSTANFALAPSVAGKTLGVSGYNLVLIDCTVVSNWQELVDNVTAWTDTANMRTIMLNNPAEGAYKNTTGSTGAYEGIPVTGNITIIPGASSVTIDANQMGRLFDVQSGGNLTLKGNGAATLTLKNGKHSEGGAIIVNVGGNLTLADGASITESDSTLDNGGGVYVNALGTFTMTGGTITECSAYNGGGVYVSLYWGQTNSFGTFNMAGGTISGCSAEYCGGGIYNNGYFTLSGGTITGCSVSQYIGGGVFCSNYDNKGAFNVTGTPTVTGNTVNGATNNVHLTSNTSLKLTGPFTGTIFIGYPNTTAPQFGVVNGGSGAENFLADTLGHRGKINGTILEWELIENTVTPTSGKATFGGKNLTTVNENNPSVSAVVLEEVSNISGATGVTFNATNSSVPLGSIPTAPGYVKSADVTVFEIDVAGTISGPAIFNITLALSNFGDKDNIKFWHYNGTNAAWDSTPLTSAIIQENTADRTVTYSVETTSFSPFGISIQTPAGGSSSYSGGSSSSKNYGGSMWTENPNPTVAPTAAPTAAPTSAPVYDTPTAKPTAQPTQSQKSPAPVAGLIAGLGIAALFLRLRK